MMNSTAFPRCKTKIVCTIGPASDSPDTLTDLIRAGMSVARLNFAHGDLDGHRRVIADIRAAAASAGRQFPARSGRDHGQHRRLHRTAR